MHPLSAHMHACNCTSSLVLHTLTPSWTLHGGLSTVAKADYSKHCANDLASKPSAKTAAKGNKGKAAQKKAESTGSERDGDASGSSSSRSSSEIQIPPHVRAVPSRAAAAKGKNEVDSTGSESGSSSELDGDAGPPPALPPQPVHGKGGRSAPDAPPPPPRKARSLPTKAPFNATSRRHAKTRSNSHCADAESGADAE
jgi:hypothetical protein